VIFLCLTRLYGRLGVPLLANVENPFLAELRTKLPREVWYQRTSAIREVSELSA